MRERLTIINIKDDFCHLSMLSILFNKKWFPTKRKAHFFK